MLQRLFQRQGTANRLESALEHSKAMEERDVLRERSATILARLERKQMLAHRAELARRKAEREAAQSDLANAPDDGVSRDTALQAAVPPETMRQDAAIDGPVAGAEQAAMPADAVETGFAGRDVAGESGLFASPEAAAMPLEDRPVAEPPVQDMAFGAPAFEEPVADVTDEPAGTAMVGETGPAEISSDAQARIADSLFRESGPLLDFVEAPPSEPDFDDLPTWKGDVEDGDQRPPDALMADDQPMGAVDDGGPVELSQADEAHREAAYPVLDEDAHEQIRKKAEEARSRIARRLEQMRLEQQATGFGADAAQRLDLGASAPPLSPRFEGENED